MTAFTVLSILAQGIVILLIVDFFTGVLHWLEDAYAREHWPIIGKHIAAPNIRHHFEPRAMTKGPFLKRNFLTMLIASSVLGVVTLLGQFSWQWVWACALGSMSNEIHCWSHRSPRENGRIITWLHRHGIVQNQRHHSKHHTDPKDTYYCVLTNWVNPILDRLDFFARCERVLGWFGAKKRIDPSVKKPRLVSGAPNEKPKKAA
ncbi:MAG: fatty acid desaturase CarF family protein [Verrucomicrobiota bacterium]